MRHLVAPLVDLRLADVVHEDQHLLAYNNINIIINIINIKIFLPTGGPNTEPILLSTFPSTLFWKSCGVVVEEKLLCITKMFSVLYCLRKQLTSLVLAEPCSPTSRTFLPTLTMQLTRNSVLREAVKWKICKIKI